MTSFPQSRATDGTLGAAAAILAYAAMISLADNYVREIAESIGLMQFQVMRGVLGMMIFAGVAALPLAIRLRPRNWGAVLARSLVQSTGMLFYYSSLAFLTVAEASAGLFTAPIFVLLIGRLVYGHPLGSVRILAAVVGFVGVVLALGLGQVGWITLAPVIAGALYALGNIATREWCAGESPQTLTAGYMLVMGGIGAIGMVVLWWIDPAVAAGADGFLLRGPVLASGWIWLLMAGQALAAVVGVSLMVRAYQLAEASRVSVFEYVILPFSAFWGWVLFGQIPTWTAAVGMGLIVLAGVMIALRSRDG